MGYLDGKAIVITGAGRGLGAAYAELAAREGAKVIVNDIDADTAEATAAAIRESGGNAIANADDISTWEGAGALIGSCVETFGRLDGLVNNAGVMHLSPAEAETPERIEKIVRVNILGTAFCGVQAIKIMKAQGSGSIVNVASGAQAGIKNMSSYGATKGAVASLTYGWAVDTEGSGVRVNAISPMARTNMYDTMLEFTGMSEAEASHTRPEQNAALPVFLLSDAAEGIHGQVVRIDAPNLSLMSHPAINRPEISKATWTVADVQAAFDSELSKHLVPLGVVVAGG